MGVGLPACVFHHSLCADSTKARELLDELKKENEYLRDRAVQLEDQNTKIRLVVKEVRLVLCVDHA